MLFNFMENNAVYLAKIQSLRRSIGERALTGFPIFKNGQNLDDFIGKKLLKQRNNGNETTINFKDFDDKIKPNRVFRSSDEEKLEKTFIKLYPPKQFNKIRDYEANKSRLNNSTNRGDENSSEEFFTDSKKSNKIESILTTMAVAKKTDNTNPSSNSSELASDSSNLTFYRLRPEKPTSNKYARNFSTSIDGKRMDDRNPNISPLVVEPSSSSNTATTINAAAGRTSESSILLAEANQIMNSARQPPIAPVVQQNSLNLNFALPKMNTQFPIRTMSPNLLANVNEIINRSSKISNVHSVGKIRKLLSLDDFNSSTEPLKQKKLPKGHKHKSTLAKKIEETRVQSSVADASYPGVNFSKMTINTKSNKPLSPLEKCKTSIESFKPSDDELAAAAANKSNKQEMHHKNYAEKRSCTEFTFKVYITDRSTLCPPTTPATAGELKNENCLLCASLANSMYNEKSDYLTATQTANMKYVVTFN